MFLNSPKRGGCAGRMQHMTERNVDVVDDQHSVSEPALGATKPLILV